MSLNSGDLFLGKYRIVKEIGGGGHGKVYMAQETTLFDRRVAIKCIHRELLTNQHIDAQQFLALFATEAEAMARLTHPAVVTLFDYGLDDAGAPYMITEFVRGEQLAYPDLGGTPTPREHWRRCLPFIGAVDQLLELLASVHAEHVVHGDIKPPNLMMQDSYGGARLLRILDFGLSRLLNRAQARPNHLAGGTPGYMAPEQGLGEPVSFATEQYTVALMLHRALAGSYPFSIDPDTPRDERALEMIRVKLKQAPARIDVPFLRPLDGVLNRALSKEPAERYDDLRAFRLAIRDAVDDIAREHAFPNLFALLEPGLDAAVAAGDAPADTSWPPPLAQCVVVMPEGSRDATNYDRAFESIFKPVIEHTECPLLGTRLRAVRLTPSALMSAFIEAEHIEQLEYSRMVIWSLTDLPVDLLKLLLFHNQLRGAVIVRDDNRSPPAEAAHLLTTTYSMSFMKRWAQRGQLDQLVRNRLRWRWLPAALTRQWGKRGTTTPRLLRAAKHIMAGETRKALACYDELISREPTNPLFRHRHAVLRAKHAAGPADWRAIADSLEKVLRATPELAPAWRDLGVAYGKLGEHSSAVAALEEATRIDPTDYDAWASYGGALKRRATVLRAQATRAWDKAVICYDRAARVSDSHPYPVLNAFRMRLIAGGHFKVELDAGQRAALQQVAEERGRQTQLDIDAPWCYLDLVEAQLYLGQPERALTVLDSGANTYSTWALQALIDSLTSVTRAGVHVPGCDKVIQRATQLKERRDRQ